MVTVESLVLYYALFIAALFWFYVIVHVLSPYWYKDEEEGVNCCRLCQEDIRAFSDILRRSKCDRLRSETAQLKRSIYGEKAMKEPERTNEITGIYAQHCVALAEELGLRCVNLWSKMQETDDWQKKYLSDGLHLTPQGNGVVYEEVSRVFREAWLAPDEMPLDFPHHSHIDDKNPSKAFEDRCL